MHQTPLGTFLGDPLGIGLREESLAKGDLAMQAVTEDVSTRA
jgi:hypothetical protein